GHQSCKTGSRAVPKLVIRLPVAYPGSQVHPMRKENTMSRAPRDDRAHARSTRRSMLKSTAGAAVAGAAAIAIGAGAPGPDPLATDGAAKHGRIKQSIVYWCFEQHWDMPQAIKVARQLGCGSIELVAPKFFPQLKQAGLTCAIGTIDMSPDAF